MKKVDLLGDLSSESKEVYSRVQRTYNKGDFLSFDFAPAFLYLPQSVEALFSFLVFDGIFFILGNRLSFWGSNASLKRFFPIFSGDLITGPSPPPPKSMFGDGQPVIQLIEIR